MEYGLIVRYIPWGQREVGQTGHEDGEGSGEMEPDKPMKGRAGEGELG